jgi:hypothetical protein
MFEGKAHALVSSIKRRDVLTVISWSAVIAFIVVKIFWLKYMEIPRLTLYHVIYTFYEAPAPQLLDIVLLGIASFLVTFLVSNVKTLIYGFVAAFFSAFVVAVVYVFLYIWYFQGWGVYFSLGSYDWEVPLFFAVLNVFRIMFPSLVATCLVGALIGFFVRGLVV